MNLNDLIYFGIVYVLIFLVYIIFINRKRLKKKDYKNMGELSYIFYKFKLDIKKVNLKAVLLVNALINAFIISFVFTIIGLIEINIVIQLLIGFVLLLGLEYSIYEIYGRHLARKSLDKD